MEYGTYNFVVNDTNLSLNSSLEKIAGKTRMIWFGDSTLSL